MVLKGDKWDREKRPLCEDLGEWRKGTVGTGGLRTQARHLELILRGEGGRSLQEAERG